ncbi:MAG: 30S ribosomal protein S2 [Coriobacteriales bacterium]|nr:30S ribosomal protein S2 [Coriobacteriales bacterium]
MPVVTMRNLLEAGVHFGHQTRRWNPKMKPYIFTERNGIYILDLQRTLKEISYSYEFTRNIASRGQQVLFVGTKKQAQEPLQAEAERSGMPYVTNRWLGGMLTNFVTMRSRVAYMERLENMEADGTMAALPKKEQIVLRHELDKLQKNLNGVRDMREIPGALFVVDTKREDIAVREARRLNIPIIGLVDTNADPDEVDFVIPGNDDAIRSVSLMARVIADGVLEGRAAKEGPQVFVEAVETPAPVVVTAETEAAAEAAPAEAPAEATPVETIEKDVCLETEDPAKVMAETADAGGEAVAAEAPAEEAPAAESDAKAEAASE